MSLAVGLLAPDCGHGHDRRPRQSGRAGGAAAHRRGAAGAGALRPADRRREPALLRRGLRPVAARALDDARRVVPRLRRPHRSQGRSRRRLLGRHEAAPQPGGRARARSGAAAARRADGRRRSAVAQQDLREHRGAAPRGPHDHLHDALHGRSRAALRSHRHRRRRQAARARHARRTARRRTAARRRWSCKTDGGEQRAADRRSARGAQSHRRARRRSTRSRWSGRRSSRCSCASPAAASETDP